MVNETTKASLEAVKAPLVPYLDEWRSIDLRVVAFRSPKDESWIFNSIRAVLDLTQSNGPVRTDLPHTEDILVLHERWPITRLDEFLAGALQGEIEIGGQKVVVKGFNGTIWSTIPVQPPVLVKRGFEFARYNLESASYVIEYQTMMNGLIDRAREDVLDSKLRATDPPWDGVADLIENFVQMRDWGHVRFGYSRMDFIAPLNVSLKGSKLASNRIRVSISKSPYTKTSD